MKFILILASISILFAEAQATSKKDHVFMKSAILPGWGEMSLQQRDRANGFFQREALLWLAFAGGKIAGDWYESDYKAFGAEHAGVDMANKSYQFAVDVGNYDSFAEFTAAKNRQREVDLKYPEGEGYEWEWDSTSNRDKFEDMRIKSAASDKYASFAVAGLILHRVISMIDVLYLKRTSERLPFRSDVLFDSPDQYTYRISINF